ncbi:MAG: citrate synthase [Planctomycetota bacterium]|nr:citrate synthase [Planctomycetota bacterium]MEC8251802.1 citrate synthase [Planctomycetota bacterium]MEC8653612.1 citrate synthase [Planctomycetota bacterium]MEC9046789.1 citrate synthase [Planctomycetota bacterium]
MTDSAVPSTAKLTIGDQEIDLPVMVGTEGELAIDIRKLRATTNAVTFDPGLGNTGSCESKITFLNGEQGILRYGGYPIEELAEHSSFVEVMWLLLHQELPSAAQLEQFTHDVTYHTMIHEDLKRLFASLPKAGHPMAVCAAAVGALSTYYQKAEPQTKEQNWIDAIRLLAKMPTIAAYSYKHSIGQPFMYPRNDLGYAANILHMMFATPCEDYEPNPVIAKALDLLLILHADHEQNCSTSTVRTVGSSGANLFASVSAGISALWGPLHGGANEAVINMLESIRDGERSAKEFMELAKQKDSGVRLMGFGHRVYKNYDPRAKILKKACDEVLGQLGRTDPLLDIAQELEQIALSDSYFIDRKLYPNVDFYSGIIYKALGIPSDMFTVFFAIGRMPGWISQWLEFKGDPAARITRPRQIYQGSNQRPYKSSDAR